MAVDPFAPPARAGGPSFRAWTNLIAGSVLVIVGVLLPGRDTGQLNTARAFLLGGGLISIGAAVARRLKTAPQDLEARIVSASVLVVAAFAVFLAYLGSPDRVIPETIDKRKIDEGEKTRPEHEWDSMRMVLVVLGVVSLAGAVLVVLPTVARKVVASLLILAHFSSILVSVTSVPPPAGGVPWLPAQLWAHYYRPYSSFMYLNNAYHFYSPEPGPPTLMWFYVKYSDKSGRWVKLPSKNDSPVRMHYQRHLALTESINVINHNTPPNYNDLASARRLAGKLYTPEIPLPFEAQPNMAYQAPEAYSQTLVCAYARYVAKHWPHPDDHPGATVKTVKVYRLIHQLISPLQLAEGMNPDDEVMDLPYFMGEYLPSGQIVDDHDPFLYFWIPIVREPESAEGEDPPHNPKLVLKNYLEVHAAGRPEEEEAKP
jgi:hypothetical protein